jgi:ribosomal-protein-alanine N-acetyltransferase
VINTLVRPAGLNDHQQLSNLVFFETHLHRHLDWRSPLEWLGAPFYWALDEGNRIAAALACPTEARGIAWIRLFVYAGNWLAENAWSVLWSAARNDIAGAGGATVAAIAMHSWFRNLLSASGFEVHQSIVMLEWWNRPWLEREANGVRVRRMDESDLPEVWRMDSASFTPLWQNSQETLRRAFSQAFIATVAENEDGLVGYQVSTGGRAHAHLARLAVHPSVQGRGAGRALLSDLFTRLAQTGIPKLTVNTQNDNVSSLNLYQKMGFIRTGEQYPVYTFNISGSGRGGAV